MQQVVGASDQEMADAIGVSRQRWSNYIARNPRFGRMIHLDGVRQLKKQHGITSEWIFLGEAAGLDDELRKRLNHALANPKKPRRGRRPNP